MSPRKASNRDWADSFADQRDAWTAANAFSDEDDRRYVRFLIPEGLRVLELGCATGQLLVAFKPSYGVGVDLSQRMVDVARRNHPHLQFLVEDAEDPAILEALRIPLTLLCCPTRWRDDGNSLQRRATPR